MNPELFFWAKGLVALTGTLVLIAHMFISLPKVKSAAQFLRYLALLAASMFIAWDSADHIRDDLDTIAVQNVGFFLTAILVLCAALASIREDQGVG